MCGRYTTNSEEEMSEIIARNALMLSSDDAKLFAAYYRETFPSNKAPIITNQREIQILQWGMEKWDGKGMIINARSETVLTSKFFLPSIKNGRCIVPAHSYFEWHKADRKTGDKYQIFDESGRPLFIAGIMKQEADGTFTYAILTKEAKENIRFIHERMPLLLKEEQMSLWLDPNWDLSLLQSNQVSVEFMKMIS